MIVSHKLESSSSRRHFEQRECNMKQLSIGKGKARKFRSKVRLIMIRGSGD